MSRLMVHRPTLLFRSISLYPLKLNENRNANIEACISIEKDLGFKKNVGKRDGKGVIRTSPLIKVNFKKDMVFVNHLY